MKLVAALVLLLLAPSSHGQPFQITIDMCRENRIDSVKIIEVSYSTLDTAVDKMYKYERVMDRLLWTLPVGENDREWMEFTTSEGRAWMARLKEQFTPLSNIIPNTAFGQIFSSDTVVVGRDSTQRIVSILSYDPKARSDRLLHTYSYSSGGISDSSFVVFGNGYTKWMATNLYIIGPNNRTICMLGTSVNKTNTEEYHVFYNELGLPKVIRYVTDGVIWYDSVYQYYFE